MATTAAAALLDELMGRQRNNLPSDRPPELQWDSPEVCHYYLVKFCPHDLFTNTKSDLGPCAKVHDDELRREFQTSSSHKKAIYEDEFIRYVEGMLAEVDKRIRKGRQRLALSLQDALANSSTGDGRVDEQIELLSERITGLVNEAERLGSEGNVEEAQGLSKLCDKLREERDQLRRTNENSVWHQAAEMAASQEKQMEVCEICSAFLIVGDAQQRIDDHLMGKQHVGYAKLREAIQEIRDFRDKAREDREKQRELDKELRRKAVEEEERNREMEREEKERRKRDEEARRRRERERERERERYRDRDRDRDYRDRRRSRSREDRDYRDRRVSMSRDEDRDRRDRRRSRSRDGSHAHSRNSRDFDRDKDRRDRDRHKDRESMHLGSRDRDRYVDRDYDRRRHREENGNYLGETYTRNY